MAAMFAFILLLFLSFAALVLVVAMVMFTIEIAIRVWPNYIVPWLDKHFGEENY